MRRKYRTIPTYVLSTYLPKSTSFVPAGTDLGVKLLTPLLFTSYDNYLRSSKSFQVHLNWIEKFGCQKPTKYGQFMMYEAVKNDLANSNRTSFNNTISTTLSFITVLFEDFLKPSTCKRKNVVKRRTRNHPSHH